MQVDLRILSRSSRHEAAESTAKLAFILRVQP